MCHFHAIGESGLERPFPAYRGAESYVFVCYAHSNAEVVYADLVELDQKGINIWYDEGIPAGSSWRAEIAAAIKGADKLLYFISEASLHSTHCLREVDYALSHDVEIIPIYLEDVSLPGELELVLNRVHGLFREKDSMYMEHLLAALRGATGLARMPQLSSRIPTVKPGVPRSTMNTPIPLFTSFETTEVKTNKISATPPLVT